MTKTTNYQLPKWEETDRIQMNDFNDMTATLDAAMQSAVSSATAALTAASQAGNCQIVHGSYIGTGTSGSQNPKSLTFAGRPLLVLIFQQYDAAGRNLCPIMIRGTNWTFADTTSNNDKLALTWSGNTVSWYHAKEYPSSLYQLNSSNQEYHYIALLEK